MAPAATSIMRGVLVSASVIFSALGSPAAGAVGAAGFIGQVLQFGGVLVLAAVLWHLNREDKKEHKDAMAKRDEAEAEERQRWVAAVAKELKRTEDVETKLHEFYGRILSGVKSDHRKEQQAAAEVAVSQFTRIKEEISAVDDGVRRTLEALSAEVRSSIATLARQVQAINKTATADSGGDTDAGEAQRENPRR